MDAKKLEADAFLLFYIKRRIEAADSGLVWFEAPYCGDEEADDVPHAWHAIEKAAHKFEQDNELVF